MPQPTPRHPSGSGSSAGASPMLSRLAGDPDMAELIKLFVEEIPERVRAIEEFWGRGEFEQLRRIAHQLKGASGGYGFPEVGTAAGKLEEELTGAAEDRAHADAKAVERQVRELIGLCRRVSVS